jgi:hypothetical protein
MTYRRTGNLFTPTRNIWVPRILAPPMCEISPALIGGIAASRRRTAATVCTSLWTQTTDQDYWGLPTNGWCAQFLENSVAREVCKVKVKMQNVGAGDRTLYCVLRSAKNGGGSQYGDNSETVTISPSAAAWYTFTWITNPTAPAGDFYLSWCQGGGSGLQIRSTAGVAHTYCLSVGTTDYNADGCYEFWTMQ